MLLLKMSHISVASLLSIVGLWRIVATVYFTCSEEISHESLRDIHSQLFALTKRPDYQNSERLSNFVGQYFIDVGLHGLDKQIFDVMVDQPVWRNVDLLPSGIWVLNRSNEEILLSLPAIQSNTSGPRFDGNCNVQYKGSNVTLRQFVNFPSSTVHDNEMILTYLQPYGSEQGLCQKPYPQGPCEPQDGVIRFGYLMKCGTMRSYNPTFKPTPAPSKNILITTKADALAVDKIMRNAGAQAELIVRWPVRRIARTLRNVCAKIPGRGWLSDEIVMVGGHRDTVGPGALDSLTGQAVLLELARVLSIRAQRSAQRNQPRRSLLVCSWDGEEINFKGSTKYIKRNYKLFDRHLRAYINLDTAVFGNYSMRSQSSLSLHKLMESSMQNVTDPIDSFETTHSASLKRKEIFETYNLHDRSDDIMFVKLLGIPVANVFYDSSWSRLNVYPLYHTNYETDHLLHLIDPMFHILRAVARVNLMALEKLMEEPLEQVNPQSLLSLLPLLSLNVTKQSNHTQNAMNDLANEKLLINLRNDLLPSALHFEKIMSVLQPSDIGNETHHALFNKNALMFNKMLVNVESNWKIATRSNNLSKNSNGYLYIGNKRYIGASFSQYEYQLRRVFQFAKNNMLLALNNSSLMM